MKVVGNIVSDRDIVLNNFNVCNSFEEVMSGLPTLVVGYNNAKDLFPNDFDILNKKIKDNIFWTHKINEDRSRYEVDLELFRQYCYDEIFSDIDYIFVDPIQFKLNTIKKIINKIRYSEYVCSYTHKEYMYVYTSNLVFGLDLNLYERFFKIEKNKLIKKIRNVSNISIEGEKYIDIYKDFISSIDKIKYVPYLYNKEDE